MRRIFLAFSLLLAIGCVAVANFVRGSAVRVDYVVQVSVDGLRGDLLRDLLDTVPASYPSFQRLRTESAHTFNARCDYTYSVTTPNHVTMVTHGLTTAYLVSKAKLGLIDRSFNVTNGALDLVPTDNGRDKIDLAQADDGNTNGLLDILVARLGTTPDAYTFLHLYQADDIGHDFGWGTAQWNSAVAEVDSRLARLFAAIDANPSLAARIAIVLTADHGGGGGGATSHSDTTKLENVTIPFFVWAPGTPAGADLYPLLANRWNPVNALPDYNAARQPLRNGDSGNLSLALLGLDPIPGSFIQPAFVSVQPWPQIARDAGGIIVRWPVGFDGYDLESRVALDAGEWQAISENITTADGFFLHSVPPESFALSHFFRLRKP